MNSMNKFSIMNIVVIQFKKQNTTITQRIKLDQFCFCTQRRYFTVSVLASKSNLEVVVKASPWSNRRKDFVQTYLGTTQTFQDGTYGYWVHLGRLA